MAMSKSCFVHWRCLSKSAWATKIDVKTARHAQRKRRRRIHNDSLSRFALYEVITNLLNQSHALRRS
jgi:hypothetical protein